MAGMRRLTDVLAVLIALAGFAVSYATQAQLASHHGFSAWESWLWPGIAEAAALTVVLRLHLGQVRGGAYTLEAWGVFVFASLVGVAANAMADETDWLNGAMHGVVPFMVLAVAHIVIHGRPAETQAETARETAPRRGPARVVALPAGDRVAQVQARLAAGETLSKARVAALLNVSQATAARVLAQARRTA